MMRNLGAARCLPDDGGRQMQEAAERARGRPAPASPERIVGKPGEEARERDASLQPRKVHAGAGVDAEAEREMAVGLAREVEHGRDRETGPGRGWPRRCRS